MPSCRPLVRNTRKPPVQKQPVMMSKILSSDESDTSASSSSHTPKRTPSLESSSGLLSFDGTTHSVSIKPAKKSPMKQSSSSRNPHMLNGYVDDSRHENILQFDGSPQKSPSFKPAKKSLSLAPSQAILEFDGTHHSVNIKPAKRTIVPNDAMSCILNPSLAKSPPRPNRIPPGGPTSIGLCLQDP